jgi:hypothetical protein
MDGHFAPSTTYSECWEYIMIYNSSFTMTFGGGLAFEWVLRGEWTSEIELSKTSSLSKDEINQARTR